MPKQERDLSVGGTGGEQDGRTIQSLTDSQYEEFNKLDPQAKRRYLTAYQSGGHDEAMKAARDSGSEERKRILNLTNGSVANYNNAVRNLKLGRGDQMSVDFAKKDLRKRRSELIKAEKEAGSGAQGMQIRLALMEVRRLLK